jgi:N-acetylglutamate synthase-like GNAT family acetyltransferase
MSWDLYELSWVMVLPEWQHLGIGRRLFQRVVDDIHEIPKIKGLIFTTTKPLFYIKMGCEVICEYANSAELNDPPGTMRCVMIYRINLST